MSDHLRLVSDDWGTEGPDYSPDQFYTRSVDGHGHSRHVRVNLPPQMLGMMEAMVDAVSDYRSIQDLIRDSLVHRLEYLNKVYTKSEQYERRLSVERRRSLVDQLTLEMQDLSALVDSIRQSVLNAAMSGDWYALQLSLDNAEVEAEAPTMRDPYRTQIHAIISEARTKYADALRQFNR